MKKWIVRDPDKNTVSKLTFGCKISPLTASVLASRGFSVPETVADRLNVNELSEPFEIKDMQEAADTINAAIDNEERICIYGDYDCDGIMSTVILYSYLLEIGADVTYYIPERAEGYGLSKQAVEKIHSDGTQLIVTVDNGISAIEEAEYIYELGMKLVVTDHHQQGETLPKAEAIVDPHRHDCFSTFKNLCGAGVALKLIAALDGGDYTMALEQFGDLAAIATVADIVSITGENRFLVSYGMELINNSDRPALIALKEVSGLKDKQADTRSIGFGLAPRINASGRFGSPKTAAELFLCEDYDEALNIAHELDSLNSSRKETENQIIAEIYRMIDDDPALVRGRTIFICGKNWHHGVIGIVAARILEKFGKPVFIASESNGEIRGSARSFGEFSIFGSLSYASDTLEKFGGHPSAGGFTIKENMQDNFREMLEEYALNNHAIMPVYSIEADFAVSPSMLNVDDINDLSCLEPYGCGNEKPLFCVENTFITGSFPLKNGAHSKLSIKFGGRQFDVLVFGKAPNEIICQTGSNCDIIGSLGVNIFRDTQSVQIIAEDIRPHGFSEEEYFGDLFAFEAFLRGEKIARKYYPKMYPNREEVIEIYKNIPECGIDSDLLYLKLNNQKIPFCKFCTAVEALRQLGLINCSSADSFISRKKVTHKAELDSAPILVSLREKLDLLLASLGGNTASASRNQR